MQPWASAFYHSRAWLACRAAYIADRVTIDGGLCETCRCVPGKIVHHTIWLTPDNIGDPTIALNHAYLRYDCQACHNSEHLRKADRCAFDADGQPVEAHPPPEKSVGVTADDRMPHLGRKYGLRGRPPSR